MTRIRWRWTAVIAYLLFIFLLSSIPKTPPLPGHADKHLHALLYGGFGAVMMRAFAGGWHARMTWTMVALAAILACLYGLSDEFHQSFVPGRQPDMGDVLADTVGALIVSALCLWWSQRSAKGPV